MVEEGVESGADGAAGVEHVIAENDIAALHVATEGAGRNHGADVGGGKVVSIELDVESAGFHGALFDAGDELAKALGEGDSAALEADQGQVLAAVAFLVDLVG